VVRRLEQQWFIEAGRYDVMPLADSLVQRLGNLVPRAYPAPSSTVLYPQGGPVSDEALPALSAGSRIVAHVEISTETPNGVLFALGDWTGGFVAYVVDATLHVAVAAPGAIIRVAADRRLPTGRHDVGCALRPGPAGGAEVDAIIDGAVVGTTASGSAPASNRSPSRT
jgi:arylsulfatase